MNHEDRAILYGLAIGDGYIAAHQDKRWPSYTQYTLCFNHSSKQKEYLEYKVDLLHSVLGGRRPRVVEFNNSGYPGVKASKTNKYFGLIKKQLYCDRQKVISRKILDKLTPLAIAIWYMDDGNLSMKKRNGKIHARELFINTHVSQVENQVIIDYFKEVHNISFTQVKNKGSYRLRCGTIEAKKFISLIDEYIIPSMLYKIDLQY